MEKTEKLKLVGVKTGEKRDIMMFDSGKEYPLNISYFKNQTPHFELKNGHCYEVTFTVVPMKNGNGNFRNLKTIKEVPEKEVPEEKANCEEVEFLKNRMKKCKDAVTELFGDLQPEHIACVNSMFIELNKRKDRW